MELSMKDLFKIAISSTEDLDLRYAAVAAMKAKNINKATIPSCCFSCAFFNKPQLSCNSHLNLPVYRNRCKRHRERMM